MKLTTNLKNLTKSQLVLFLKESEERIKDESLLNEVVDALINAKKLKKDTIYNLANKVQTMLLAESIVENSTKQKEEPKKEEPKKDEPKKEDSKKDEPKKAKKKKLTKKQQKEEPKDEPKAKPKDEPKDEPKAKFKFPKEIKLDDDTVYKLNNRIKTVESLKRLISQGKKVLFANVWLPEHLEQFEYDIYGILDRKIERFPNDVDLVTPVLISRNDKIIYAVSIYTDVMCVILADHLRERNSFGVEFRIYVAD